MTRHQSFDTIGHDPQLPGRHRACSVKIVRDLLLGFKEPPGQAQQPLSCFSQTHLPGVAVKQQRVMGLFELAHLIRNGRL